MCIGASSYTAPVESDNFSEDIFKVGDKVVLKAPEDRDYIDSTKPITIKEVDGDGVPLVSYTDADDGSEYTTFLDQDDLELAPAEQPARGFPFDPVTFLAPEPAFKLGDLVEFVEDYGSTTTQGERGVVTEVVPGSDEAYHDTLLVSVKKDDGEVVIAFQRRLKLIADADELEATHDLTPFLKVEPAEVPLAPGVVAFTVNGIESYFKLVAIGDILQLRIVDAEGDIEVRGNVLYLKEDGTFSRNFGTIEERGLKLNAHGQIKKAK